MAERRRPFKRPEQEKMLKYWEKMLKERNEGAYSPCGNLLWEKYVLEGHSTRNAGNLSSHFRRQIVQDFWEWWDVEPSRIMNIFRMWNPEFTQEMKSGIERKLGIKITLKTSNKMKDWRPNTDDENEIKEEDQAELKRRASDVDVPVNTKRNSRGEGVSETSSIKPRRSMSNFNGSPIRVKKETPKKPDQIESPISVISAKSSRNRAERIESVESMPDPNEHNYTREIRDTKRQARVRHSTREALGLPPILTPRVCDPIKKILAIQKNAEVRSPIEIIADASFHEDIENQSETPPEEVIEISSEANANADDTLLMPSESNRLFEGQGNNIDTFDANAVLPIVPKVSIGNFREETILQAFSVLQEKLTWIGETELDILRNREQELYDKLLIEKDPKMSLDHYMEEYLEGVGKISDNFMEQPDLTLELRYGDASVDEKTRTHVISSMMKDFIEKISPKFVELISEMIQEKEPYIYFGASDDREYTDEMRQLSDCIWEKLKSF